MVKAVFFDFFGVIMTDLLDEWLYRHGIKRDGRIEEASIKSNLGEISHDQFLQIVAEEAGMSTEAVTQEYQALVELNQEVVDVINEVHQHLPTALISNAHDQHLRDLLNRFKLEHLFDHIIISGEVGAVKPHHEIYNIALDRAGVVADEVVFTDDRPTNIEGAQRVGIKQAFVFTDSQQLRQQLYQLHVLPQ